MSWFQRGNTLRNSLRRSASPSPPKELDANACFESFKNHWQQAWEIIGRPGSQTRGGRADGIRAVMTHIDQMVTLLLHDLRIPDNTMGPILDYLLTEEVLDKLFVWSTKAGENINALKLEQLKLYEVLISHSQQELLVHKPILQPLLKLLSTCSECAPVEVEKRLVILLNQLCVSLTQNAALLEFFFCVSNQQETSRFLIFSLLIPFVHREGGIGQQARDALLLCMSLSRKHASMGLYIAEHSNFCPILATGLSALYSVLPRKLTIETEDWHRFTADDVHDIPELAMFMNSFGFCNAVIQVSYPVVQEQLLEYIYQGFLVPVLGPALNQTSVDEIISATAYLDLFLRTITEPVLLQTFLKFIFTEVYDGIPIVESLVARIATQSRLCLVTLALFRTLIDFNCEDVLLQLVFRYLIPCTHVMVSQRCRVRDFDIYSKTSEKFLLLTPACCLPEVDEDGNGTTPESQQAQTDSPGSQNQRAKSTTPGNHQRGFSGSPGSHGNPQSSTAGGHRRSHSGTPVGGGYQRSQFGSISHSRSMTMMEGEVWQQTQGDETECYHTNYGDYLLSAARDVRSCLKACESWVYPYNGECPSPEEFRLALSRSASYTGQVSTSVSDSDGFMDMDSQTTTTKSDSKLLVNCDNDSSQQYSNVAQISSDSVIGVQSDDAQSQKQCDSALDEPAPAVNNQMHKTLPSESLSTVRADVDSSSSKVTRTENDDEVKEIVDLSANTRCEREDDQNFWTLLKKCKTPPPADIEDSLEEIESALGMLGHQQRKKSQPQVVGNFAQKDTEYESLSAVYRLPSESKESTPSPSENSQSTDSTGLQQFLQSKRSSDHLPVIEKFGLQSTHIESFGAPDIDFVEVLKLLWICDDADHVLSLRLPLPHVLPKGPFLSTIFTKLENMMQNNLYINLQLTGLITRLACYPQPLLRSFLLNHTLVFQPTVRSLLQVLGSLKHKLDSYSSTVDNFGDLLTRARKFLKHRDDRLILDSGVPSTVRSPTDRNRRNSSPEGNKVESKRRSLTDILFRRQTVLGDKDRVSSRDVILEDIPDGTGYRYINRPFPDAPEGKLESLKTKNAVLCAVVLEEFLKELAAVTQEHSVADVDEVDFENFAVIANGF